MNSISNVQERELRKYIKELYLEIKRYIEEEKNKGNLKPDLIPISIVKIDNFEYSKNGVIIRRSHTEDAIKKIWVRKISELKELITKSASYIVLLKHLEFNNSALKSLDKLIIKLIEINIEPPDNIDSKLEEIINDFINLVFQKPIKYLVEYEIIGLVVPDNKTKVSDTPFNVDIERVKKENLEKVEISIYSDPNLFFNPPSSLVTLEFSDGTLNSINKNIRKVVTILKIFKIGGVVPTCYRIKKPILYEGSPHRINYFSIINSISALRLNEGNAEYLKKFWIEIFDKIPENFYNPLITEWYPVTIAYRCYNKSIFMSPSVESVTNIIMGLESVYLESESELKYKLGLRVAKIFGLIGNDSIQTRNLIQIAYDIRSVYVHGSNSDKLIKKLYNDYEMGLNEFIIFLLDCLRISIIIMIHSNILSPKQKKSFLDLIDESMIDVNKFNKLEQDIKAVREILRKESDEN